MMISCTSIKYQSGFALIEIIVAILISAFLLSQVTTTFGSLLRVHGHYADSVERLPQLKTILNKALFDLELGKEVKGYKQQLTNPNTDIVFSVQDVQEKQGLGNIGSIKKFSATATWDGQQTREPLELVMYVYVPKEAE